MANGKWHIDERGVQSGRNGAGNNWATGYEVCSGALLYASTNSVRRELEQVDMHTVLLNIHSIGGGTGSGMGSRMTEAIKDEFPGTPLMNLVVLPYHSGEVVVQHYNASLALASISKNSDAILVYENQVAHQLCVETTGCRRPTVDDVNRIIAGSVASVVLPKYVHTTHPPSVTHPALSHRASGECASKVYGMLDSRTERWWGKETEDLVLERRSALSRTFPVESSDYGNRKKDETVALAPLHQDIEHLCPDNRFKFLEVKTMPQGPISSPEEGEWGSMLASLQRMARSGVPSVRGMHRGSIGTNAVYSGWAEQRNEITNPAGETFCSPYSNSTPQMKRRTGHMSSRRTGITEVNGVIQDDPHGEDGDLFYPIEVKNIASNLIVRGESAEKAVTELDVTGTRCAGSLKFQPYYASGIRRAQSSSHPCAVYYSNSSVANYQRSVSLLTNGQGVVPSLQVPVIRGGNMFRCGAYVHQYLSNGMESDDFVDAFSAVQHIINDYKGLK
eukprot:CAMPEP_0185022096 /NCGR_PEP_ID=MMETSP1103-20130426/4818_1 /TAXON_ID=36769 /ORGANISM="Paraphysomonas bandaiensis, Strain Caron Lab Isolate" /LENGTH=503 /DNA_ID=CAMNT_0027554019 /DNA_START=171 /DNA_END=1682 /DNA_ORIENTATION=-